MTKIYNSDMDYTFNCFIIIIFFIPFIVFWKNRIIIIVITNTSFKFSRYYFNSTISFHFFRHD